MRIGIISLPLHSNYGGILQAWALQKVLISRGHDVVHIDRIEPKLLSISQKLIKYPARLFKKHILGAETHIRREERAYWGWRKRTDHVRKFVTEEINLKRIKSLDKLKSSDFDFLIFGSDQVWRPIYFRGNWGDMRNAFGWFARVWKGIGLASYSASFGIDSLEEFTSEELKDISGLLQRYRGISVREESGVQLCRELNASALQVLDPTMLIEVDEYLKILDKYQVGKRSGIMTYILDPTNFSENVIRKVESLTGYNRFSTLSQDAPQSLEQWIAGFRDADIVLTDSFHACVFSILFGKRFIVIPNPVRGQARIESLLNSFNLDHHLIKEDQLSGLTIEYYDQDKERVKQRLDELRRSSFNFLDSVLS